MGLLVCSFVFLPFFWAYQSAQIPSFPAWNSSPQRVRICMFTKKSQSDDRGWKYSRGSNAHRAVTSKGPLALLWHMRGRMRAWEPDAPFNSKTTSSIACSQTGHPQAPAPLSLAMPPCWGTETNVAPRAASPAWQAGGRMAHSSLSTKKPSTTSFVNICFKHVPLRYQHLVRTF